MITSSREAAEIVCGQDAVEKFALVKRFQTRFGLALQETFAHAVGGSVGLAPDPDVVTELGAWEFCTQANTKNASGSAADARKVAEGHLVQVLGRPRLGWISGVDFLQLHGVDDPKAAAGACVERALEAVREEGYQLSLNVRPSDYWLDWDAIDWWPGE